MLEQDSSSVTIAKWDGSFHGPFVKATSECRHRAVLTRSDRIALTGVSWSWSHMVVESRGRGLRAMSGLNCELYRRCLSSASGADVTAAAPLCILASTCSVRCLSWCSRRSRSARSSSIVLLLSGFTLSLLCRRWLCCKPCTVSQNHDNDYRTVNTLCPYKIMLG